MNFKHLPVDQFKRDANFEAGFELVNSPELHPLFRELALVYSRVSIIIKLVPAD